MLCAIRIEPYRQDQVVDLKPEIYTTLSAANRYHTLVVFAYIHMCVCMFSFSNFFVSKGLYSFVLVHTYTQYAYHKDVEIKSSFTTSTTRIKIERFIVERFRMTPEVCHSISLAFVICLGE